MENKRQEIKPSAHRFVVDLQRSDKLLTPEEYQISVQNYISKKKLHSIFFIDVSNILDILIKRELKKLGITLPQMGFEWAGGVLLAFLTGKVVLLPANYVIYPTRVALAYLKGEKVTKGEFEGISEWIKFYTTKFSPTGKGIQEMANLYRLVGISLVHKNMIRNLRKKAKKLLG